MTDMTNAVAGSSSMRMLCELGAEILKIESPSGGDFMREFSPTLFHVFNRGKRSVSIDVKDTDGGALVRQLALTSDVFVESMRPGTAESLGLGRDDLTQWNPRLIYASLSGFGSGGPSSSRRSIDAVIQAESGLAAFQGDVLAHSASVDVATGVALTAGILAAVLLRERTGEVNHVEASLLGTALYLQSGPISDFSASGKQPDSDYLTPRPLVGVYDTADHPLFLGAYWPKDWEAVCAVLELPELLEDPRFGDARQRSANRVPLSERLQERLLMRPRAEWIELLERRGVLAGGVRTYAEVLRDEHVQVSGAVETIETDGAPLVAPRTPYRLIGPLPAGRAELHALGQDTEQVLDSLGVDRSRQHELWTRRVIERAAPQGPPGRD